MSDESTPDETPVPEATEATETTDGESGASQTRPRGTAAASAASRARRIGGRVPGAGTSTGTNAATTGSDEPDVATDPARRAKTGSAAARKGSTASAEPGVELGKPAPATPGGSRFAPDRSDVGGPVVVHQAPAWLPWTFAAVMSVLAVAMVVIVLVAAHSVWYAKPSSTDVRDRVLAAAKSCTAAANTYSYRTLDQDEKKGLACSTGKWTDQYRKAMTSLVKPVATKLKASQSIQINTAGIESVGASQWTVLIFGQTNISQAGAKAQQDPFAAKVVMTKAHGSWLISHIDLVSSSSS